MDGKEVKVCPFHKQIDKDVREHWDFIHNLDKKIDVFKVRLTLFGSLNLIFFVVVLLKLFNVIK